MADYMTCEICGKEYCVTSGRFTIHLRDEHKLIAKEYYDKFLRRGESEGICLICGKETYFNGLLNGYAPYCSKQCSGSSPLRVKNIQKTNLERYGVKNVAQSELAKAKARKTNLERYGFEYYLQTPEKQEKSKQTCLKKYGTKYNSQSEEVKNKTKQTNLKKYGSEWYISSKDAKKKSAQTKLERYGDENYNNRPKMKQTKLERYGDANYTNIDKMKQTKLERYGVEYYNNTLKAKQTTLLRYGDENFRNPYKSKLTKFNNHGDETFNNPEQRKQTKLERYGNSGYHNIEQMKQTNLKKYGTEWAIGSKEIRKKSEKTLLKNYGVKNPGLLPHVIEASHSKEAVTKAHETKKRNGSYSKSKLEDSIYESLINIFNTVERQHKEERYPFNCDFYIPEKDMFIEVNGYYTHNFEWYDKDNLEHIAKVKEWKSKLDEHPMYKVAIDVWTKGDVKKRNTARDNNLNYVVLWNMKDFEDWIADGCPDRQDWR